MNEEKLTTSPEYPKLELGGKTYELKFTRGLMYRMDKAGVLFNATIKKTSSTMNFSNIVDVLHMAIRFDGTHEDLAELAFDRRDEITSLLVEAWSKVVLPSLQARVAALSAAQDQAGTKAEQVLQ